MRPVLAFLGLGAAGELIVGADWRIILGSAIGTFAAYVVGAVYSKSNVEKALKGHAYGCASFRPTPAPLSSRPTGAGGAGV